MTTLTAKEASALLRLLDQRHAIMRWEGRLYVRIFTAYFVLNDEKFVPFAGLLPDTALMDGVARMSDGSAPPEAPYPLSGMIGARVCWSGALSGRRYGRIVAEDKARWMVQVEWEGRAAPRSWTYPPGSTLHNVWGESLEIVEPDGAGQGAGAR